MMFVTRTWLLAAALVATVNAAGASAPEARYVVPGGKTAFTVDVASGEVVWEIGNCRRRLALEPARLERKSLKGARSSATQPTTEILNDTVDLGDRTVELRQQFRFDLDGPVPAVDVYSSVRGGWTRVPLEVAPRDPGTGFATRSGLGEC